MLNKKRGIEFQSVYPGCFCDGSIKSISRCVKCTQLIKTLTGRVLHKMNDVNMHLPFVFPPRFIAPHVFKIENALNVKCGCC